MISVRKRTCKGCNVMKEHTREFFHKSSRTRTGLNTVCKVCVVTRTQDYARRFKDKVNKKAKRVRLLYPERSLLVRARQRALTRKLSFNITKEDIIIPLVCPILGIPIIKNVGRKLGPPDNRPSLDRIDNNKGYTKDNIVVCSNRANQIKNCGTAEEHQKIAEFMKRKRKK